MSASSKIVTRERDGPRQSDYGTFGRYVETPVDRMSLEMREAFEFTKKLRGEVPGPHKIWPSNPKLSKTIVPTGRYFQTQSTLTRPSSKILTGKKDGTKHSGHGTFGRYVETPVDRMSPEMRDAFEFTKKLRGEVPGPRKIWPSNPKLSKTIVPTGRYFQTQSTLTKPRSKLPQT